MAKKCPPGVLCIENSTIIVLFLLIVILAIIIYYNKNTVFEQKNIQQHRRITNNNTTENNVNTNTYFTKPSGIMTMDRDLFLNPYMPPLKENRFIPQINMRTRNQNINRQYKQIGLLTRVDGKETILPIFGRPLYTNRNKWQYYTMTDNNNMVRLPISKNGRSCTNEYGCDELFNGENVFVEGYKDSFDVTVYENETIPYIP